MSSGNEGGGTFHAIVWPDDDGQSYTLVDEPFENVPEGGPHLSADEARAHDTLPFIWMVASFVMADDRRAWWLLEWITGPEQEEDPVVAHLDHAIDRDPTLCEILDLPRGWRAERQEVGGAWDRYEFSAADGTASS